MTDYTIPRANAPIAGTEAPTIQWYNYLRFLDTRTSSASGDVQAEITTIAEKLGSPDGTVGNIPPQGNIRSVQGLQSVTANGSSIVQLALVNDLTIVDPVYYYGTDSAGAKGWNLLFDAFADTANIEKINTSGIVSFDLTDLTDSGVGTLLATTFDAKGRKTGSRAATLTTASASRITIANPDASAGLPTFDLATVADAGGGVLLGLTRDSWGRVSGTHAITVTGTTNQVAVAGGTGSGAAITLSTPQDIATSSTPAFAQVALAADPTTALQAATKQYVDSVAAGLSPKAPALLATTANDSLSGLAARDGFTPSSGSRVLVKNQTLPAQNGIYIASAVAWTRATDMATWAQVPSAYLWIEEGTINADTGWVCTSDPGGVIGVTAITFVQFGGNGTVTAGTGISVTGNQVSLANTAVTPASYGDATHVATFTVDQQGRLTAAGSSAISAEPPITAGTTAQYWRGDKTWRSFLTDVLASVLTGLSTATNAVITATDTVLVAMGKLQAQITGNASIPAGYIDGLKMVWNSATSISATSGTCYIQGSSAVISFPSLLTLSGLSLTGSTWYHLYGYLSSGTPAIELVTTAPASSYSGTARSKAGDTSRRYIGSIRTDASGNAYNFLHVGNFIRYQQQCTTAPFRVLSGGLATTFTSVSLSNITPITSSLCSIKVGGDVDVAMSNATFAAAILPSTAGNNITLDFPMNSQAVTYKNNATPATGAFIDCFGYIYER